MYTNCIFLVHCVGLVSTIHSTNEEMRWNGWMYTNCIFLVHCVDLRPKIEQSCSFNNYLDEISCATDRGKSNHQNHDKINWTACAEQMEKNLQEELSVYLHFRTLKCCQCAIYSLSAILGITIIDGKGQHLQMSCTLLCACSYCFRDITILKRNFTNSWWRLRSAIFANTPLDGQRQNLQMTPTRLCIRTYCLKDITFKFLPTKSVKVTEWKFCNNTIRWQM